MSRRRKPALSRDFLTADGWKSPNSYSNATYEELPDRPGLYLFLRMLVEPGEPIRDEVLYVGMSTRIARRVSGHEVGRLIPDFFQTWFKEIDGDRSRLLQEERRYIQALTPRFNIIGKQEAVTGSRRRIGVGRT